MKKQLLLAAAALALATSASAESLPKVSDARAFINNYQTRVRLQKLLGPASFNTLRNNFEVTSVLQNDDDIMAFSGCKRHNCADTQSLIVYDRMNDSLRVWYHHYGKVLQTEEDTEVNEDNFGVDLQDAIEAMTGYSN